MSTINSGCTFAILTDCVDKTNDNENDDERLMLPLSKDEEEWSKTLLQSPLLCDLDFASDSPAMMHDAAAAPSIFSYSNRQLTPCGLNSVFVVQQLSAKQALIDVSNCRLQVSDELLLPMSIKQTTLQWKTGTGHVRVDIDVSNAKKDYLTMLEEAQLEAIRIEQAFTSMNDLKGEEGAHRQQDSCIVGNVSPNEAVTMMHPHHAFDSTDALHRLKLMVQDEVDDMHHLLVATGITAIALVLVFIWTVWQIHKPKKIKQAVPSVSTKESFRQPQQQAMLPITPYHTPARHQAAMVLASVSPVSPEGSSSNIPDLDSSTSTLSPCSKLQLQLAERRRMRHKENSNNSSHCINNSKKRTIPVAARRKNPFAAATNGQVVVVTPPRTQLQAMPTTPPLVHDATKSRDKESDHTCTSLQESSTLPLLDCRDEQTIKTDHGAMSKTKDTDGARDETEDDNKKEAAESFVQDYWGF
ncbi:hypothetical protein MPSEU_000697000 [Mayamaea pseudoterrestris]|nr:hypothetical protein MPSEU_000697000 [Mayamaea pseudoterrestris]